MSLNSFHPLQRESHEASVQAVTHGNELVGVVHHGDQHVQQNHQRDDVVRPKHGRPHKLGELVAGLHVGHIEVQQPKYGPEEGLESLKQPEEGSQNIC